MIVQLKLENGQAGEGQSGPPPRQPDAEAVLGVVSQTIDQQRASGSAADTVQVLVTGLSSITTAARTTSYTPLTEAEYQEWVAHKQNGAPPPRYYQFSAEESSWREEQCIKRLHAQLAELDSFRIQQQFVAEAAATARKVAEELERKEKEAKAQLEYYTKYFSFVASAASTLPPLPAHLIPSSLTDQEPEDITDRDYERAQEATPPSRAPVLTKPVEEPSFEYRVQVAAESTRRARQPVDQPTEELQTFWDQKAGRYFTKPLSQTGYSSSASQPPPPAPVKKIPKPNARQRRKRRRQLGISSPTKEQKRASGPPPKKPRHEDQPRVSSHQTSYQRSQQDRSSRPRSPPHRADRPRSPPQRGRRTPPPKSTPSTSKSSGSGNKTWHRSSDQAKFKEPQGSSSHADRSDSRSVRPKTVQGYQGSKASESQSPRRGAEQQQSRSSATQTGKGKAWASRPQKPAPTPEGISAYVPSKPLPEPVKPTGQKVPFRIQPPVLAVSPSQVKAPPADKKPANWQEFKAKEQAEKERIAKEKEKEEERQRQIRIDWNNARAIFNLRWPEPRKTRYELWQQQWDEFVQLTHVKYPDETPLGLQLRVEAEHEFFDIPLPRRQRKPRLQYIPGGDGETRNDFLRRNIDPTPELLKQAETIKFARATSPPIKPIYTVREELPKSPPSIEFLDDGADITDPPEAIQPGQTGPGGQLSPRTEYNLLYPEGETPSGAAGSSRTGQQSLSGISALLADSGELDRPGSSVDRGLLQRPGGPVSVARSYSSQSTESRSRAGSPVSNPGSEPHDIELSPGTLERVKRERTAAKRREHHRRQQLGAHPQGLLRAEKPSQEETPLGRKEAQGADPGPGSQASGHHQRPGGGPDPAKESGPAVGEQPAVNPHQERDRGRSPLGGGRPGSL